MFGDWLLIRLLQMFTAWPDGLGLLDLVNIFGSMIDHTILQLLVEGESSIKLKGPRYPALTEV